jgi:hypothetical protein
MWQFALRAWVPSVWRTPLVLRRIQKMQVGLGCPAPLRCRQQQQPAPSACVAALVSALGISAADISQTEYLAPHPQYPLPPLQLVLGCRCGHH